MSQLSKGFVNIFIIDLISIEWNITNTNALLILCLGVQCCLCVNLTSKRGSCTSVLFPVIKVISGNCLLNISTTRCISFLLMIWEMSFMKLRYIIFLFGKYKTVRLTEKQNKTRHNCLFFFLIRDLNRMGRKYEMIPKS